jgi:predicted phosphodiesterase
MSLSEHDNVEMIQGNTDKMIAEYSEEIFNNVKKGAPIMANALRKEFETLSENQKQFLKNLPVSKELEIDGIKILMVHGSPRRNNEDIMPDTPLDKLEEMLEGVKADLILCGHTHIPCGFQTNSRKTVVNDGSVGRPFTPNPDACYAIITTKGDKEFEVEHNFVQYDYFQASKVLASRDFEGADKLAGMLINPSERHM